MSAFVEKVSRDAGYELCGRMLVAGDDLALYVDEVGRFSVPVMAVRMTLMGMGECQSQGPVPGVFSLSDSGRGLYLDAGGERYVMPLARVMAVLEGRHRKGPVSRKI